MEIAEDSCIFANPAADPDVLPQDLLRKYLTYAKQHCRPQLQQADYDRIQRVGVR